MWFICLVRVREKDGDRQTDGQTRTQRENGSEGEGRERWGEGSGVPFVNERVRELHRQREVRDSNRNDRENCE